MARACQALIDLDAIRRNYRIAQTLAPGSRNVAVVKANAYGHDAVRVCRALAGMADAYGVASIEEALELRSAGIREPLLLLEGFFEARELPEIVRHELWTVIHTTEQAEALLRTRLSLPIRVWLKFDTGMHRLGLELVDFRRILAELQASAQVASIVLMSHLACTDAPGHPMNTLQLKRFAEATAGIDLPMSLANSGAILGCPAAHREWNRPGFLLYGNSPFAVAHPSTGALQAAMTLRSEIIALHDVDEGESVGYGAIWRAGRPSRIATVAIGYGDGYPAQAPAGTPMLVNGRRAPLVGRVSMDLITVDVTDLPTVGIKDPVVLWGEGLPVNEVAAHMGTIPYELVTRLSLRIPKVFVGGGDSPMSVAGAGP